MVDRGRRPGTRRARSFRWWKRAGRSTEPGRDAPGSWRTSLRRPHWRSHVRGERSDGIGLPAAAGIPVGSAGASRPAVVILDWRLESELSAALSWPHHSIRTSDHLLDRQRHGRAAVDDPRQRLTRVVDKAGGNSPFEEALAWALETSRARCSGACRALARLVRAKTSAAFIPPNPKEVETAASTRAGVAARRTVRSIVGSSATRLHVPGSTSRSMAMAVMAASIAPEAPRACRTAPSCPTPGARGQRSEGGMDRARLGGLVEWRARGVGVQVADALGCDASVRQRRLDRASRISPVRSWRGHVVRVVGCPEPNDLGDDPGPAAARRVPLLERQDRGSLTHH